MIALQVLRNALIVAALLGTIIHAEGKESMTLKEAAAAASKLTLEFPFKKIEDVNRVFGTQLKDAEVVEVDLHPDVEGLVVKESETFAMYKSQLKNDSFDLLEMKTNPQNFLKGQELFLKLKKPIQPSAEELELAEREPGKSNYVIQVYPKVDLELHFMGNSSGIFAIKLNNVATSNVSSYGWKQAFSESWQYLLLFALYGLVVSFLSSYFEWSQLSYWKTFGHNLIVVGVALACASIVLLNFISGSWGRSSILIGLLVVFGLTYLVKVLLLGDTQSKYLIALIHPVSTFIPLVGVGLYVSILLSSSSGSWRF